MSEEGQTNCPGQTEKGSGVGICRCLGILQTDKKAELSELMKTCGLLREPLVGFS